MSSDLGLRIDIDLLDIEFPSRCIDHGSVRENGIATCSKKLTFHIRRYLNDEDLKNDSVQYRHIYEELKIEAAMIAIVCPLVYCLVFVS